MKIKIQQLVEKVRRSPSDNGSFEVQGKWKSRSVLLADDTSLLLFCCSYPSASSFLYQGGKSPSGDSAACPGDLLGVWVPPCVCWLADVCWEDCQIPAPDPPSCTLLHYSACSPDTTWSIALLCQHEPLNLAMEPKCPSASDSSVWSCWCPSCAPLALPKASVSQVPPASFSKAWNHRALATVLSKNLFVCVCSSKA